MHNFLTSQPDLNFHNAEVQDALLDTVKFWLDLGVDGYRLDTANFYFHDAQLRNNPPRGRPTGEDPAVNAVNPYGWQWHKHDKSQPENLVFLRACARCWTSTPTPPWWAKSATTTAWPAWPSTPAAATSCTWRTALTCWARPTAQPHLHGICAAV